MAFLQISRPARFKEGPGVSGRTRRAYALGLAAVGAACEALAVNKEKAEPASFMGQVFGKKWPAMERRARAGGCWLEIRLKCDPLAHWIDRPERSQSANSTQGCRSQYLHAEPDVEGSTNTLGKSASVSWAP